MNTEYNNQKHNEINTEWMKTKRKIWNGIDAGISVPEVWSHTSNDGTTITSTPSWCSGHCFLSLQEMEKKTGECGLMTRPNCTKCETISFHPKANVVANILYIKLVRTFARCLMSKMKQIGQVKPSQVG